MKMLFISLSIFAICASQVESAYITTEKRLLNDGNWMPSTAYGTYMVNLDDRKYMRQAVTWAIEAGYRHVDTASLYASEDLIGEAFQNVTKRGIVKRTELYISTKLPFTVVNSSQVIPAIRNSLKRLQLDYLDLCLIHTPRNVLNIKNRDYLEIWKGLEEAKRLGLTRSIGVSNFNATEINRILVNSQTPPAVNQIEYPAKSARHETYVSKNVRLLNDGHTIPVPAFGTANDVNELENVRQAVFTAIESGYRHIDTAASYTSEDYVAQAVTDAINCGIVKREDLFICTKMDLDANTRKKVVPALKLSLQRLQLDFVDLFLFHTPYNLLGKKKYDLLDIWKGFEDAKKLGLTKSIGTSNFEIEHLAQILPYCTTTPAINQLEVNPTFTNTELVEYCQNRGIVVTAYGPMGFTVPRANVTNPPPPSLDDPVLLKIANKYGVKTSQVVLRYLIDRGMLPLSRSSNKQHIQLNIDLFNFSLTDKQVDRISEFNVNRTVYGYRRDAIFEDYRIKLLHANRRNKKLYPLSSIVAATRHSP